MVAFIIAQIVLAFIYSIGLEWFLHKYILHGLGKNKRSVLSFHYHDHHRNTRTNDFRDPAYERLTNFTLKNGSGKEIAVLTMLILLHTPLLLLAPWAFLALFACSVHYFVAHTFCHKFPEWGRRNFPWHYAHHMAPNQESNWGVRFDWIDKLLGTREYYVDTERELRDIKRRAKRKSQ